MGRTALCKPERKMDLSVNMQPGAVVVKSSRTDGFLPNTGIVQPWGVQCVPVLHEVSREF